MSTKLNIFLFFIFAYKEKKLKVILVLQETSHALLNDYCMTIHEYATSLEVDLNPPEIIAIYAMAKAFNMDLRIFTEHLEWFCP